MGRHTIRRFLRAGSCPERVAPKPRSSILWPYEPYLRKRWAILPTARQRRRVPTAQESIWWLLRRSPPIKRRYLERLR